MNKRARLLSLIASGNIFAILVLGLIISLFTGTACGANCDVTDMSITLDYPANVATVEIYPQYLVHNATASVTSGNTTCGLLRNATLLVNVTTNRTQTLFENTSYALFSWEQNFTVNWNGTSNSTAQVAFPVFNNTNASATTVIANGSYVSWCVKTCNQGHNCSHSENRSYLVHTDFDDTAPVVSVYNTSEDGINGTFYNYTNFVGSGHNFSINFTVTDDTWIENVSLILNHTFLFDAFNSTLYNWTFNNFTNWYLNNASTVTGTLNQSLINTGNAASGFINNTNNVSLIGNFTDWMGNNANPDGTYYGYILAVDYNGNIGVSENFTFHIDTRPPSLNVSSITNVSLTNKSDIIALSFTISEHANITVHYGENESVANTTSETAYTNGSRSINLTGLRSNRMVYYNITLCDQLGNCNDSAHLNGTSQELEVMKEFSAKSGWSIFGVLNNATTLGSAANNVSSCTMATFFNNTNQTFHPYVTGTPFNENVTVERGQAIMIYTTNNSWVNQTTFMDPKGNTTILSLSVSFGSSHAGNWTLFGMLNYWTLGNLTHDANFWSNITYRSWLDPDRGRYTDHIATWTWNNDTELRAGDALWGWTDTGNHTWSRNETFNVTYQA